MREIFVFGSNLAGRHGKGAALAAKQQHGAIYGRGVGLQGDSYAIPTKGHNLEVLDLDTIQSHVVTFLSFARTASAMKFNVTRVGCGLAGYKDEQIAPMFKDAPSNCVLPPEWLAVLEQKPAVKQVKADLIVEAGVAFMDAGLDFQKFANGHFQIHIGGKVVDYWATTTTYAVNGKNHRKAYSLEKFMSKFKRSN